MKSMLALASVAAVAIAAPVASSQQSVQFCNDGSSVPLGNGFRTDHNQDPRIAPCDCSISYSQASDAQYEIFLGNAGNGQQPTAVTIWGGKKCDRGIFDLYNVDVEGRYTWVASGDAYGTTDQIWDNRGVDLGTASMPLLSYNIPAGQNPVYKVQNRAGVDPRVGAQPWLEAEHVVFSF